MDAADPTNALARLAGALGQERPLIASTHATDIGADRVRSVLVPLGCVLLAGVRAIHRAEFAVCHARDHAVRARWCASELSRWSPGALALAFADSRDFGLVVRHALAAAQHVIVLAGPTHDAGAPGWRLLETHADRVAGMVVGDEPVPGVSTGEGSVPDAALSWTQLDPDDEAASREAFAAAVQALAGPPTAEQRHLAGRLANLRVYPGEPGQPEQDLAATREAVELHRALAEARPDVFLPDLATSLSNLGVIYSRLGQPEHAVAVTREALDLYSELFPRRPAVFEADLARCVSNMEECLRALGQDPDQDADLARARGLLGRE